MKEWRYKLDRPFTLWAPELVGVPFSNEWLTIKAGLVTISSGYAWDGCSPAYPIMDGLIWLGIPDGPLMTGGRPVSWQASLVHDALCQFRPEIPGLKKSATVKLFQRLLCESRAPALMRFLYPVAVYLFGPQKWGIRDSIQ